MGNNSEITLVELYMNIYIMCLNGSINTWIGSTQTCNVFPGVFCTWCYRFSYELVMVYVCIYLALFLCWTTNLYRLMWEYNENKHNVKHKTCFSNFRFCCRNIMTRRDQLQLWVTLHCCLGNPKINIIKNIVEWKDSMDVNVLHGTINANKWK